MTVIQAQVPMALPTRERGRFLLENISWEGCEKLLEEIGDGAVRMTYDDGLLEFALPTELHQWLTKLLSALVEAALIAAGIDYQPLGSTTWRRRQRTKGLEADECYYVASVSQIAGKARVDLERDPPPDLAIETEVTSPLLNKLAVYAALGIPELWRVAESGDVRIFRLFADGKYQPAQRSHVLPQLDVDVLTLHAKMLTPIGNLMHSQVLKQFRRWLAGGAA